MLLEHQIKENAALRAQLESLRIVSVGAGGALANPTTAIKTQVNVETAIGTQVTAIGTQVNARIIINVYGKEDLSHITKNTVQTILDESLTAHSDPLSGARLAFVKMAMKMYGDAKHPENATCYIPNAKHNTAMVHRETGWERESFTVIRPDLAKRACDILFELQPFTANCAKYGDLLRTLADNEERFRGGPELRDVLLRSKQLIEDIAAAKAAEAK